MQKSVTYFCALALPFFLTMRVVNGLLAMIGTDFRHTSIAVVGLATLLTAWVGIGWGLNEFEREGNRCG